MATAEQAWVDSLLMCLDRRGQKELSRSLVPAMISNAAAAQISIKWNPMGPSLTPVSACAIGNTAIGQKDKGSYVKVAVIQFLTY